MGVHAASESTSIPRTSGSMRPQTYTVFCFFKWGQRSHFAKVRTDLESVRIRTWLTRREKTLHQLDMESALRIFHQLASRPTSTCSQTDPDLLRWIHPFEAHRGPAGASQWCGSVVVRCGSVVPSRRPLWMCFFFLFFFFSEYMENSSNVYL